MQTTTRPEEALSTIIMADTSSGATPVQTGIIWDVQGYSIEALGGPRDLEVTGTGEADDLIEALGWLGLPLITKDIAQRPIWWGRIVEVVVTIDGITRTRSLDDVVNRYQVRFTEPVISGRAAPQYSAWTQDDASVAKYGIREQRANLTDMTSAAVTSMIAKALAQTASPPPALSFESNAEDGVLLRCAGWWSSIDLQYFYELTGYLAHDANGDAAHILGQGYTNSQIGFSNDKQLIHDMTGTIKTFKNGAKIVVAGSTSNNGVYTVASGTTRDPASYTAATISFHPNTHPQIRDLVGLGLGEFDAGDMILVSGAGANNGSYRVVAGAGDGEWIEVDRPLSVGAAGPSVTISRGNAIGVEEALVDEYYGASVSLASYGSEVAQRITLVAGDPWTINTIAIRVKKVGAPSDNLTLGIYTNSGGSPGTVVEQSSIAGTLISESEDYLTYQLSNTTMFTVGTDYWIDVSRSGSFSATDYYEITLDEEAGYSGGQVKLKQGSWAARSPDADMPFIVLGATATTVQIAQIVANAAQFITGIDVKTPSGISTPQYQDGSQTALDVLSKLLELGTSINGRLLATVSPERFLRIEVAPSSPTAGEQVHGILKGGRLVDGVGEPIPPYQYPVGVWATLRNSNYGDPPMFIERVTWRKGQDVPTFDPLGRESVWDAPAIRRG